MTGSGWRVGLSVGARLGVVVAFAAVVAAVGYGVFALAHGPAPPNYALAPTRACLRAHGYAVSRPFGGDFGRTVEIDGRRRRDVWLVAFTKDAAQAQRNARTDPYGIPVRWNVVFDIESIGLQPRDAPIVDCLRV